MTKWDDYIRANADYTTAYLALLSSRETYVTLQSRLREAAAEEANDQMTDLEARVAALAPLVEEHTRHVGALAAEAEELRARAVVDDLSTVLDVLAILVDMAERFGAQMPRPADVFATAAMLAERAQQYAGTLPKEEYRLRAASNELAMRVQEMQMQAA